MTVLPYLLFSIFILYAFFGVYSYLLSPRSLPNRVFMIISACYAGWVFSFINMQTAAAGQQIWLWHRVSFLMKTLIPILLMHFFACLAGEGKRARRYLYLAYAPGAVLLSYGMLTGTVGAAHFTVRAGFHAEVYNPGNAATSLYLAWYGALNAMCVPFMMRWRKNTKDPEAKRGASAVLFAGIPAAAVSVLTGSALPLSGASFPDVAPLAGIFWIAGAWHASARHGFLAPGEGINFNSVLKSMAEGLILTDSFGKIRWANGSANRITGYSPGELLNAGVEKIFRDKAESGKYSSPGRAAVQEDTVLVSKDGTEIPVFLNVSEVVRDGGGVGRVFSFQDMSERKRAEERIRYISFHDTMTGLYNRAFVEEEMDRLDTPRQLPLSIIMCDVKGLKTVNDFYGHAAGDSMIVSAAEVIRRSCRKEDIIARWGGDEFVIFLPKTSREQAGIITERIAKACPEVSALPMPLSIISGIGTKDSEEQNIKDVIKEADKLMYLNKIKELESALPASKARSRERTVLIVEDEEDFSNALGIRLGSWGYSVLTAESAEQGLYLAKNSRPDLIIMDVMLPGEIDGCSATELIKKDPSLSGIPVIMISAKASEEDREKGLLSGANYYFTKPMDLRELLGRINMIENGNEPRQAPAGS